MIRPDDVTVTSGRVPTYTWRGDGWVNGDTDATLATLPHRSPPAVPPPGAWPLRRARPRASTPTPSGALGAVDANYDICYARASLRVDPVISLDVRGLPASAPRRAYVDGLPVALPLVARDVRFGSRHSYRFAQVVLDRKGRPYVTSAARFEGPVTDNVDVTARYLTMRRLLRQAEKADGIRAREAARLKGQWLDLQSLIKPRRSDPLRKALHRFADRVERQRGETIDEATAAALLVYAQAVYRRVGGAGAV